MWHVPAISNSYWFFFAWLTAWSRSSMVSMHSSRGTFASHLPEMNGSLQIWTCWIESWHQECGCPSNCIRYHLLQKNYTSPEVWQIFAMSWKRPFNLHFSPGPLYISRRVWGSYGSVWRHHCQWGEDVDISWGWPCVAQRYFSKHAFTAGSAPHHGRRQWWVQDHHA